MRSHAICIALFLVLPGAAFAQIMPPPTMPPAAATSPSACLRGGHAGMRDRTPQLVAARHAMKRACAVDEARFCANVPKACGQAKQCMMEHEAQLSPVCANAWQNMQAARHGA